MTNDDNEKREAVLDQLVAEAQASGEYGMTDEDGWIEHDGGPQPVADDAWVEVAFWYRWTHAQTAGSFHWGDVERYRILNQRLIKAARAEGFLAGQVTTKEEGRA